MKPHLTTNQRIARAWAMLAVLGLLLWLAQHASGAETEVTVSLSPRFRGEPLVFDELRATNSAGQAFAVTRLDLLLSGVAVRRANGPWLEKHHWFAFINAREGRTNFVLRGLPAGDFDRLRFTIGVPAEQNHADPAQWDAAHPLNPLVNGLHWNWRGGYVFLALEGRWALPARLAGERATGERVNALNTGLAATGLSHPSPTFAGSAGVQPARAGAPQAGFSWHLATERQLMRVELPVVFAVRSEPLTVPVSFDLAVVMDGLTLSPDTSSTHSREGDELADWLRGNVERAFAAGRAGGTQSAAVVVKATSPSPRDEAAGRGQGRGEPNPNAANTSSPPLRGGEGEKSVANPAKLVGTPYRFTYAAHFPKPALPLDNPLTEEGVALGRRLFNDPLLSKGEKQSCASCHQMDGGTVDAGRAFSLGVDGLEGKRNAMPLYNLAWKSEFFWDGRAKSLRQQALMPIQDELEMHETLPNVVEKLKRTGSSRREEASTSQSAIGNRQSAINQSLLTSAATSYGEMFTRAFGTPDITAERVGLALEQFLLTVTAFDSKFDRVVRGEATFTVLEQRGFELFHTENDPRRGQFGADCFHCHGGPLFQNVAFANNGLEREPKDLGRFLVTGRAGDKGKFSVPSLRNVELTAPYMHDGRHHTLEEAVFHYVRGVQRSETLDPNLAKHRPGGIHLPPPDLHALVAFLKTLTDESLRPARRSAGVGPPP
jgi:cytochrome c peroxidase